MLSTALPFPVPVMLLAALCLERGKAKIRRLCLAPDIGRREAKEEEGGAPLGRGLCSKSGFTRRVQSLKTAITDSGFGYELHTDDDDQSKNLERKAMKTMSGFMTLVVMAVLLAASSFCIGMLPLFFAFSSQ